MRRRLEGEGESGREGAGAGMGNVSSDPEAWLWRWTLAGALLIIALGAAAVVLPLSLGRPVAESAGWIVLLGGVVELLLGTASLRSPLGKALILCGGLGILAGLAFLAGSFAELFTLTNFVMAWLFARSLILLVQGLLQSRRVPALGYWLLVRAIVDGALAATLLLSLPVIGLLVVTFGETREAVTTFSGLLSISFLATGIALLACAFAQRRLGIDQER